MTPKEKAEELFRVYYEQISGIPKEKVIFYITEDHSVQSAFQCAIIAVNEIIELNVDWNNRGSMKSHHCGIESTWEFWQEVLTKLKAMQ